MMSPTIIAIALPFLFGFSIYLLPKFGRYLALSAVLVSASYAAYLFATAATLELHLLDRFGVTLIADSLSGFFILTNALVAAAVVAYCWSTERTSFFYMQVVILHGSLNAVFISADLISLYVALEAISVAAFLLIVYPRSDRVIWVGLRYLFISNTAMLFYLIGAVLVYQTAGSFAFTGLAAAPIEAVVLILLGLMTKGGVAALGLWLPQTHAEATAPVSALLSGIAVKAGIFPLVRCVLLVPEIQFPVMILGLVTALLGVTYALFERDIKRLLAFSTISQLGFILAAPSVGGLYALAHGLAKALLFLTAGTLPSRDLSELRDRPLGNARWLPLALASFSVSGLPLLAGYGAKSLAMKAMVPWQVVGMNIAACGTAIVCARLIFLPRRAPASDRPKLANAGGFAIAASLLGGGLLAANGFEYQVYTPSDLVKSLAIVGGGWLAYWLLFRRLELHLPHTFEQFERLVGTMSLALVILFGLVLL